MTTSRPYGLRRRLPIRGAAVAVAFALLAAACSGSDSASSETTATPTTAGGGTGSNTTASEQFDGRDLIASAVESMGGNYEFSSTVSFADGTATTIEGRLVQGRGIYLVQTADTAVEYLIALEGRWVREAGEDWLAMTESAPVTDPLEGLSAPLTAAAASSGKATLVTATYAGASLGFADTEEVLVDLTLEDGRLAGLSYSVAIGEGSVGITTGFSPLTDTTPITLPAS